LTGGPTCNRWQASTGEWCRLAPDDIIALRALKATSRRNSVMMPGWFLRPNGKWRGEAEADELDRAPRGHCISLGGYGERVPNRLRGNSAEEPDEPGPI